MKKPRELLGPTKQPDALGAALDRQVRKRKAKDGLRASGAQKDTVKLGIFGRRRVWTPPRAKP